MATSSADTATEILVNLCRDTDGYPDVRIVQQCVQEGANFLTQCPRRFLPILHHFTQHGLVDCVVACLQTSRPIDFTVTNNKWDVTVFHCICEENSPETAATLLRLFLDRLRNHPEDVVDWSLKDIDGHNFVSSVAMYQLLSHLWPIIKETPEFEKMPQPVSLCVAWAHDLEGLESEDQKYFTLEGDLIRSSLATRALNKLCKTKVQNIDPSSVQRWVDAGADIGFWDPIMNKPIFHFFVFHGLVECVAACLSTPNIIDFTAGDGWGWTPLHFTCPKSCGIKEAVAIMQLIVERIESHPEDIVAWDKKSNDGYDFISCAAKYQKLSVLWPVVMHMPYYSDHVEPIPLTKPVWKYDWDELGDEQTCFVMEQEMITAERCTAELVRNCEIKEWKPDANSVRESVLKGADICFTDPEMNKPILHHFVYTGLVECVEACLETLHPIDFTVTAEYGWTVLHYLTVHNPPSVVAEILQLILRRLESHHTIDMVNWFQKDEDGNDFISYAGYYNKLPIIWPLVRNLPSFTTEMSNRITLTLPVHPDSWRYLGEWQANFILMKGISTRRDHQHIITA